MNLDEKHFLVTRSPKSMVRGSFVRLARVVEARTRAHALRVAAEGDPENFAGKDRDYAAPVAWALLPNVTYRL